MTDIKIMLMTNFIYSAFIASHFKCCFLDNVLGTSCQVPEMVWLAQSEKENITCEQPGVKAPGTPKITCLPLPNAVPELTFVPGSFSYRSTAGNLSPTFIK